LWGWITDGKWERAGVNEKKKRIGSENPNLEKLKKHKEREKAGKKKQGTNV